MSDRHFDSKHVGKEGFHLTLFWMRLEVKGDLRFFYFSDNNKQQISCCVCVHRFFLKNNNNMSFFEITLYFLYFSHLHFLDKTRQLLKYQNSLLYNTH